MLLAHCIGGTRDFPGVQPLAATIVAELRAWITQDRGNECCRTHL
jgi:hypothetical protein